MAPTSTLGFVAADFIGRSSPGGAHRALIARRRGLRGICEKSVLLRDKKFSLGWEFRQCSGLTCRLEQTGHLFSDPGAFPLRVGGFEILAGMDPVHSQTVGVSFKGADGGLFLKNVPLRDRKFRFGWGFPGRSGLKMHLEAPGNLHWQYQDGPRCWRGLHVKSFRFWFHM